MKPTPELLETLGISREEVVTRAAELSLAMIEPVQDWTDDESPDTNTIRDALQEQVSTQVSVRVNSVVEPIVQARVEEITADFLKEHIESMNFQRTDSWGSKKGNPISFKELVATSVSEVLTKSVDYNGRWDTSASRPITYAQWLLMECAKKYIKQEITKALGDQASIIGETISSTIKGTADKLSAEVSAAIKKL